MLNLRKLNKLPYEEYLEEIGPFTEEQFVDYVSKIPINESQEPVQPIEVDYPMEEDGGDAEELINKLRKRLEKNVQTICVK